MKTQTILGSGGAIGTHLAEELRSYTQSVRLVSRNPLSVHPKDELRALDLTTEQAVDDAVKGSEVVYVTIGFPYNIKVWRKNWPSFINHVVQACLRYECKLVFFDNIYMYDPSALRFLTEDAPVNPPSKKGKVRADILRIIQNAESRHGLQATIARSADFYGPGISETSIFSEMILNPLAQNKKATWMGDPACFHSFTYTPDAAKATALLGNSDLAYGETWHLPTAAPLTGKEWIDLTAEILGVESKLRTISSGMLKFLGIFVPVLREMPEMLYQYDRDYVFDSSKFEQAFKMKPTSVRKALGEIIKQDFPDKLTNSKSA